MAPADLGDQPDLDAVADRAMAAGADALAAGDHDAFGELGDVDLGDGSGGAPWPADRDPASSWWRLGLRRAAGGHGQSPSSGRVGSCRVSCLTPHTYGRLTDRPFKPFTDPSLIAITGKPDSLEHHADVRPLLVHPAVQQDGRERRLSP
jgi:hypothetical protein